MFYVVDASVYIFRAWFSMPDDMHDKDGNMTNALYGFTRFLGDFLEHSRPDYVAVAFDTSLETCFRNDIYPEYKANREPAPPELKQQFDRCREVTRSLGLREFAESRYEADDIIGTLVHRMRRDGMKSTILSRDKDLAQLLDAGDVLWDYVGGKRTAYKDVPDKFGVRAEQMVDFLALAGDSVDNIPGVRGVGLYERLDEVHAVDVRGAKTLAGKLAAKKSDAMISRRLTQIHCEVPVEADRDGLRRAVPDMDALDDLYDHADFGQMLRRQAARIAEHF
jgi:5'-3' exonuclease